MKVTIVKILNQWVLSIGTDQQIYKAYTFNKLIDAIDTASCLQIHIDNECELPIKQYGKGS